MKGLMSVADAITLLTIAALFVLLLAIIPKLFSDFFTQLAMSTSEVVARDLAGLITISAAAPKDITISYFGAMKKINYSVDLSQRVVKVDMIRNGKSLNHVYQDTYAVDNLNKNLQNYNSFKIIKRRMGYSNNYDFQGE